MEQVSLKIGERLKEIRNTRQFTLDDVAGLAGVQYESLPYVAGVEAYRNASDKPCAAYNVIFYPNN